MDSYLDNHLLPTPHIGLATPQMHLASDKSLGVDFHSPKKLTEKTVNSLPPCAKVRAYETDCYVGAPKDWMRGNGKDRSYFVPVQADRGLWLDFNRVRHHKKHVAVLVSIQGLNPVTGMPLKGMKLEQYDKDCPVHNHAFEKDRFCKDCGFNWPKQNYLCTTGTPGGLMWIDGFRGADGTVRQYYFTPETMKGVAAQILGEKRVFALGVAFFLSKTDKPEEPRRSFAPSGYGNMSLGILKGYVAPPNDGLDYMAVDDHLIGTSNCSDTSANWVSNSNPTAYSCNLGEATKSGAKSMNVSASSEAMLMASKALSAKPRGMMSSKGASMARSLNAASLSVPVAAAEPVYDAETIERAAAATRLEIAAGEKIDQKIFDDPQSLDFWEPEPAGTIYINYCPSDLVDEILKLGEVGAHSDGFLQKLKVGA